jgi:hypothetical protein
MATARIVAAIVYESFGFNAIALLELEKLD